MTRESRAWPDVPNGKPLGRHVKTSRRGRHVPIEPSAPAVALPSPRSKPATHWIAARAIAVIWMSTGIVGTLALPAYAADPDKLHAGGLRPGPAHRAESPTFAVPADVRPADAVRDQFGATTMEQLEAARQKDSAAERAFAEAKQRALQAAAAGKTVEAASVPPDPAPLPGPTRVAGAAPPAPSGSIVAAARRHLGVPYVFGGASPSGFDCSGLVLYVYAQFAIPLPHSSLRQAAGGTRVADPVPGDLVVLDGGNHIGIYSGDGYMIDAPMPGRVVNERPIYTVNHYFVRY